jgi:hypothetical protein
MDASESYLENNAVDATQIDTWIEQFHRDGYLFLKNILTPATINQLKADLDQVLAENPNETGGAIELHHRMFETSATNLGLFDMEPIVSFAEALIANHCHVIHNNNFRTPHGGGIISWHQDDSPHFFVTHGEPPTNIRLPVLLFTANYYLTDVLTVENGPTQVIPGSHLFGASPPNPIEDSPYADQVVSNLGPAGSVIMFNNQVWHRGGPNTSDQTRYMAQVTYARRLVGHKYYPFMNYTMPEHVYKDANPRLRQLLGFLPHGAYG